MFDWLPILDFLQGKRVPWDGVLGMIGGVWIEIYDGKIFAFPNNQTRHVIKFEEAGELYLKRKIQPTLFEL